MSNYSIYMYILQLYIYNMAVVLSSFICKRPFLANKQNYFHDSFATPTFTFRGGLMLKPFAESFAQKKYKIANSEKKTKSRGLMLEPWRPQLKPWTLVARLPRDPAWDEPQGFSGVAIGRYVINPSLELWKITIL